MSMSEFSVEQARADKWLVSWRVAGAVDEPDNWMSGEYLSSVLTRACKQMYNLKDRNNEVRNVAHNDIRNITPEPEPTQPPTPDPVDRAQILSICTDTTLGAPQARAAIGKLLDPQFIVADEVAAYVDDLKAPPEPVEHVVAVQVNQFSSIHSKKGNHSFPASDSCWDTDMEVLVPRTELTFDGTGRVTKQDGCKLMTRGQCRTEVILATQKSESELARLKANVMDLLDFGINVDPPSLWPDEVVAAVEGIVELCKPDAKGWGE